MKRAVAVVVLIVAAGVVVPLVDPMAMLVVVLAVLVIAPLVARAYRRQLDVFEPIVWANAALFGMFVLRPVAHWAYDSYSFRGFDIEHALGAGLLGALVGTAAIQFGYAIPAGRAIAAWLPVAATDFHRPAAASAYALTITTLGVSAFLLFPSVGLAASAYLYYLPMLVIPGALLLLAIGLRMGNLKSVLLGILALAGGFIVFAPSGQRAWLLVLLAPALTFGLYLRRGMRPGVPVILAILVASFIFVAAARDLEPGESLGDLAVAIGATVIAAPQKVEEFALGPDTEMLDGFALEVEAIPRALPFQPGSSLASLIAQPIPRALWPDKPRQADDLVNELFFGDVGYEVGKPGVAYSLFGGFYFDLGLLGVLLGGAACGILFRIPWEWFRRNPTSPVAALQLAATLPFVVLLARGNLQDTLSRALFVIVPILLVELVSRSTEHSYRGFRLARSRSAMGSGREANA